MHDHDILRVYIHFIGKFLRLPITHVLQYDEIFMKIMYEPDFTSIALNTVLLNVAIEACDFECPNDDATYTGSSIPCDKNNPNSSCQCPDLCFCHDHICHSPESNE